MLERMIFSRGLGYTRVDGVKCIGGLSLKETHRRAKPALGSTLPEGGSAMSGYHGGSGGVSVKGNAHHLSLYGARRRNGGF